MLATLNQVLKIAEEKQYAIAAFNTPTLESLQAAVDKAEEYQVPVIVAHAQLHEPVTPLSVIGPVMVALAKKASVPVCVHLDHGETLDYLKQALELGFTSVMYDGSALPYEENVANTKKAVAMAREYGANVEAEIGSLGKAEGAGMAHENDPATYTDPSLAEQFVKDTGVDALACSFGTAHGIYTAKPKLDFPRIEKIHQLTGVPLVMHGGSGVSPEDYVEAIKRGVRKINYYTYMAREGTNAAKAYLKDHPDVIYYHDIACAARDAMKNDVEKAMSVFYGLKK